MLMPVVLVLIMAMVQVALGWHARSVVEAAASDALIVAQADGGTEDDAGLAARSILEGSTDRLLSEVSIEVDRGLDVTTVSIRAHVTSVLPFAPVVVHAEASGPTERFRSEVGP